MHKPESVNGCLATGQVVYIHTPENPRLHGTKATVKEVTDYGALLDAPAAASRQFRAVREEMTYEPPLSLPDEYPLEAYKGHDTIIGTAIAHLRGYTGDYCQHCGGCRMRRNGNCNLCEDCGSTSGCS